MPSFAIKVIRLSLKGPFRAFSTTRQASPHSGSSAALRAGSQKAARRRRCSKRQCRSCNGRGSHVVLCGRLGCRSPFRMPQRWSWARVLVAHGWGSRSDYLATLIDGLLSSGAEVVALDLPGHGASPGRTTDHAASGEGDRCGVAHFDGFDVGIAIPSAARASPARPGQCSATYRARVPGKLVLIGAPSEMTWLFRGFGRMLGLARRRRQLSRHGGAALRASHRGFRMPPASWRHSAGRSGHPSEDDKEVPADHARRYGAVGPMWNCTGRTVSGIAASFRRSCHREDQRIPLGAQERGLPCQKSPDGVIRSSCYSSKRARRVRDFGRAVARCRRGEMRLSERVEELQALLWRASEASIAKYGCADGDTGKCRSVALRQAPPPSVQRHATVRRGATIDASSASRTTRQC